MLLTVEMYVAYFSTERPHSVRYQVPVSPYDNALAIDQMQTAYSTLLRRPVATNNTSASTLAVSLANDKKLHPRLIR